MESVMTKKEVVYIQDQNGSAYNGTITFETSSISNSGKFADWTNAYFVIPYVVTMVGALGDISGTSSRFSVGMKAGWWHLIHSMSVDLNGINIIQQTPFLNLYASYKCITNWSYTDMVKNGDSVGFWKDSVDSFQYFAAQNASGSVISNNTIIGIAAVVGQIPAIPTTWAGSTVLAGYNEGYFRRLVASNYYNGGTAQFLGATAPNAISSGLSVCGQATANTSFYWRYNCVIRLRDLSDFFDNKVPLHRGGVYRFTLNYNSGAVTVSYAAGPLFGSSAVVQSSGQSLPYIFSSGAASNPNSAVAQAVTLTGGVVNSSVAGVASPSISACRLYVPLYTLNEAYEEQLLSLNPEKTIQYKDLYQYTISSTGASGNFNALVTNGLSKPLTCVVIPFADYSLINGGAAAANATGLTSLNTPFSSTPATTDPGLLVRNFNIQVSGINIFPQNIDYTFVEFQNELSKINAVNGNCTSGLTSGLIGQHEYERGYSYHVADLSRSYSADDFVPKSILITGTNVASIAAIYYVFVEYMRTVTINLASGNVRV
jgi:hypothetical protein